MDSFLFIAQTVKQTDFFPASDSFPRGIKILARDSSNKMKIMV